MVFASKLFSFVAFVVFQASKDLESYVQFDGANLYSILHPKKSHKAPTEFCFCIVVSEWLTKTNPSRPEKTSHLTSSQGPRAKWQFENRKSRFGGRAGEAGE